MKNNIINSRQNDITSKPIDIDFKKGHNHHGKYTFIDSKNYCDTSTVY